MNFYKMMHLLAFLHPYDKNGLFYIFDNDLSVSFKHETFTDIENRISNQYHCQIKFIQGWQCDLELHLISTLKPSYKLRLINFVMCAEPIFFSKIDNCRNLDAKSCYAQFLNMHVGSTRKINSKSTHQIMDFFVLSIDKLTV